MSVDYMECIPMSFNHALSVADKQDMKGHYGCLEDSRISAEEMDTRRKENIAYEYLCRLEEAKVWIEACIREIIPDTVDLEEGLRNGVVLAKLAHFISPDIVPIKKIFDSDLSRYKARGLQFRHTDNINHWIKSLQHIDMPRIFYPETTDIYDRKNMPRAIYCIHALSMYLYKLGRAPQIQDLYGKISFTDEQISNMRKELDKYGIQMPAFSKINGILANEIPVDEAALHAAVIAINEAIEKGNPYITVTCLLNSEARLAEVLEGLQDEYQTELYRSKHHKAQLTRDRSVDSEYVMDAYDELLTQAEIQQQIYRINRKYAVDLVVEAVDRGDENSLVAALRHDLLRMSDVISSHSSAYLHYLAQLINNKRNNGSQDSITREEIHSIISSVNQQNNTQLNYEDAVVEVNRALRGVDAVTTYKALQNPQLKLLSQLDGAAMTLYHEELKNMREEKQEDLDYDEIVGSLPVLVAIARVNQALARGNVKLTYSVLNSSDAHISDLDEDYQQSYHQQLCKLRDSKVRRSGVIQNGGGTSDMLTHCEIQQCIRDVNIAASSNNDRVELVRLINAAVDGDDSERTLQLLQMSAAGLTAVKKEEAEHYHQLLHIVKLEKQQEMQDTTAELWYEEIQSAVDLANSQAQLAYKLCVCVGAVNLAIDQEDRRSLVRGLKELRDSASPRFLPAVCSEAANDYMQRMRNVRDKKEKRGDCGSGWMMLRMDESGIRYYFNVQTMQHAWVRTADIKKDHSLLTLDDVKLCLDEVSRERDSLAVFRQKESNIIYIQAAIRGYLARRKYRKKHAALSKIVLAVIKIQSWWRMIMKKKEYMRKLDYYRAHVQSVLAEWAAIKIQAFMRSAKARQDYKAFIQGHNAPLSVVRKFVHLLDVGDNDYTEEIELEKLRQRVIGEIRGNKQLEQDLNQMDIKIGLLVRNRITLQDVLSHSKMLKKYETMEASNSALSSRGGLKALSKASRERLEAYQHLFYLLQTEPVYLAKLIFEMPQSRMSRFLESALLTLYNYASSPREEYLLLKLFKTALEQEISSKVHSISDIMTGNPIVVKIIVGFNRNTRGGSSSLRDLLNPLVRSVVEGSTSRGDNTSLKMNTNPVEVYKQWVNQIEAETGRALGLPYEVSLDDALKHEEVRQRIDEAVQCVQRVTESFLSSILESIHLIPYGMRYMAKVMRDALRAKFPNALDKELLKMVGNLIYYRYINSAIVAPDAFDIMDVGAANGLTSEQRRNLGSVAKILQFAASNKGFGADSPHLVSLNKYIMDAHIRFKKYFTEICDVEDPELHFKIDQYTDVSRVTKPVIYISVGEIIEIHRLLLEHQSSVAPDVNDPLHELLDDLGDVLDVDSMLGIGDGGLIEETAVSGATITAAAAASSVAAAQLRSQLAKTEISLTLSNKFEAHNEDLSDKNNLMLRTKRMVIDVIRCQRSGDNLSQILNNPATSEEEAVHQALIRSRERSDMRAMNHQAKMIRQPSIISDMKLPLDSVKKKISVNLEQLERLGVVSRRDGYQSLIQSIIQDIRNQRMYRQQRRLEMMKLTQAAAGLREKRSFYEEQINYYNQYVKTCLEKQNTAKIRKNNGKAAPKITVKYSAHKLHEKGVVLEIEGLPLNQFKNVLFEISSTEVSGVFDVNAKFMGVSMEKVQLLFQDLLELQYEGVAVMKMFDRAKINVNLLVFLLNKKFFSKKK